MRARRRPDEMQDELVTAIGLVWGHLSARQYEEAYLLAQGCMHSWPENPALRLMHAFAAGELGTPVDTPRLESMRDPTCEAWIRLVLQRIDMQVEDISETGPA